MNGQLRVRLFQGGSFTFLPNTCVINTHKFGCTYKLPLLLQQLQLSEYAKNIGGSLLALFTLLAFLSFSYLKRFDTHKRRKSIKIYTYLLFLSCDFTDFDENPFFRFCHHLRFRIAKIEIY